MLPSPPAKMELLAARTKAPTSLGPTLSLPLGFHLLSGQHQGKRSSSGASNDLRSGAEKGQD